MDEYNVLVVEDEELESKALQMIISGIDNIERVDVAKSGNEAITKIDSRDYDLAFVDLKLPGINGIDVIKYLKEKNPGTSVIISTAYDELDFLHSAIKLKVDDYLLKPTRSEDLRKVVESCLTPRVNVETEREVSGYTNRYRRLVNAKSYKESVILIKEFVLWAFSVSNDEYGAETVLERFAKGMIKTAKASGLSFEGKLHMLNDKFQEELSHNCNKYEIMHRLTDINDEVFSEVFRKYGDPDDRINRALNYIEKNIRKNIRLEDVADHVNVSPYYMSKIFKKEVHINFMNYVTNRKMSIAKEMLADTTLPVVNIAIELSFSDANYFGKAFKRVVGVSPNEYRRKLRSGNI
ncbi:MAG: response regulator [Clostridiales Family XIII bacterium]|nr:response regulator [Clostridiales Family XIII bacterium]